MFRKSVLTQFPTLLFLNAKYVLQGILSILFSIFQMLLSQLQYMLVSEDSEVLQNAVQLGKIGGLQVVQGKGDGLQQTTV